MEKSATEDILTRAAEGTFLVRNSSKTAGCFVLSVQNGRNRRSIRHFLISRSNDGFYVYSEKFETVSDLLAHYTCHHEGKYPDVHTCPELGSQGKGCRLKQTLVDALHVCEVERLPSSGDNSAGGNID